MGTWVLVEKPPDTKPIANKWVFTKKRNKEGKLTKYKARLVAKGCALSLPKHVVKLPYWSSEWYHQYR